MNEKHINLWNIIIGYSGKNRMTTTNEKIKELIGELKNE